MRKPSASPSPPTSSRSASCCECSSPSRTTRRSSIVRATTAAPSTRSAIFPVDAEQRAVAEAYVAQLTAAKVFAAPIATTIEPAAPFYPAEAYHQNYAARNPHQPYVAAVAAPKVDKLQKYFGDRLKG